MEKLNRFTDTGLKAWTSKDSGLPMHYRQILGVVRNPALVAEICDGARNYPRKEVLRWLDELDTLGFLAWEHITVAQAA